MSRWGHWVIALLAVLLFSGCATLPDEAPRPPTKAMAESAATALGKLARAAGVGRSAMSTRWRPSPTPT